MKLLMLKIVDLDDIIPYFYYIVPVRYDRLESSSHKICMNFVTVEWDAEKPD